MKSRGVGVVRAIAVFRLAKSVLLIICGLATLRLLKPETMARLMEWGKQLQVPIAQRALVVVTRLSPERLELLAIATFLYAALFIAEGVGLWMDKVWAEWLTIIATTSFIPFELYEVVKKATAFRIVILIANIVIVVYLLIRRRKAHRGPLQSF